MTGINQGIFVLFSYSFQNLQIFKIQLFSVISQVIPVRPPTPKITEINQGIFCTISKTYKFLKYDYSLCQRRSVSKTVCVKDGLWS